MKFYLHTLLVGAGRRLGLRVAFGFFAAVLSTTAIAQTTRYVKPTSSGTGDGSSWANASANF